MANDITGRVWSLDTVGVIKTGHIMIDHIAFVEYAAITDKAILKDAAGRVVLSAQGHSDFGPVEGNRIVGWVDGLTLDTLDSGKVLVYMGSPE